MDEVKEKKESIRSTMIETIDSLSEAELESRVKKVEERLFDFANFMEAKVPLLYVDCPGELPMEGILRRCFEEKKVVVLPTFNEKKHSMTFYKVDDFDADMKKGPRGILEPDPERCKRVPMDKLDIAIIPGLAFDEKGGRVGTGMGYYDRLIPRLPITTRKVSMTLEAQLMNQTPTESHDKYIDIIITDERVIYKI